MQIANQLQRQIIFLMINRQIDIELIKSKKNIANLK